MENFNEDSILQRKVIKRNIMMTSGKCALILSILSIATLCFGNIITHILKLRALALGLDLNLNSDFGMRLGISNDAYNFFIGYLPCIIADIVAIIICIFTFKINIKRDLICKSEVPTSFICLGGVAAIGVGIISSIIFLMYSMIFRSKGIEIPSPDFTIPTETIYLITFFSYTCVIAPIFEEIIFRGFILNSMRKYGNMTAIIVSSIFFSMFHFNLVQFINPILMGIIFSFIVIKSKSIIPSIIVHMMNNTLVMMTAVISNIDSQVIIGMWTSVYYFGGIIALILFIFKYGRDFINIIKETDKVVKIRKKILYSFTNKWSLLYILIYISIVGLTIVVRNN